MLTIVAQGGLCNRLRVVLSALYISRQTHAEVRVMWPVNDECHARFEDLFEPLDAGGFRIEPMHFWATPSRKRNLHLPRMLRTCMGYTWQRDGYVPQTLTELEGKIKQHKRLYVSSGALLAEYTSECLKRLRPRAALQIRIDSLRRACAPHTIGVHIRRTDNVKSIAASPVESFVEAMRCELAEDSNAKFYLATDDAEVKQRLETLFPQRIITQHVPVNRNTLAGMEDALVDLWCLAGTAKLLGSYWSSFTDAAAEIGRVPLVVVKKRAGSGE